MKTRVNYFLKWLLKETKTVGEVSDPGLKRWNNFYSPYLMNAQSLLYSNNNFLN